MGTGSTLKFLIFWRVEGGWLDKVEKNHDFEIRVSLLFFFFFFVLTSQIFFFCGGEGTKRGKGGK